MFDGPADIVQKLWNYCNVLRDDGMSYGDYVEQRTYLLFLKMADERSKPPYNQKSSIPEAYNWQSLLKKDGEKLFEHYRHLLEELGKKQNLLGLIFGKSQNKFQDPAKLRRNLLKECDVHTLLRLPTGLFYAQGVKANVLFFDKRQGAETHWTEKLWVYDLRTNKHFTLKTGPLKREDLDEFVACYNSKNRHERKPTWSEKNPEGRWRAFDYEDLVSRDKARLDLFWLKDESLEDSENLPEPDILAQEIVEDLEAALEQFRLIANDLGNDSEEAL